jgi:hypothetical protein
MCSICQKEGHLKQNCPEENLPQISPLPTLSPEYKKLLNDLLLMVPGKFQRTTNLEHCPGFCPGLMEWWTFSNKFEQIMPVSLINTFRLNGCFFVVW